MNITHVQAYITDEQRWNALVQRDGRAEGAFFYGVKSTGIFCRPTCASRLPRRENVAFFASPREAQEAGFRPCKRCQPQGMRPRDEIVLQACRIIEDAQTPPTLESLAQAVGLSRFHFQRLFKQALGVTPKQYYMEKRAGRLRAALQQEGSITEAITGAGYASHSQSGAALGMKPSVFRRGAGGVKIGYAVCPSYLGWTLVAATPAGICCIEFGDRPEDLEERLRQRFPAAELQRDAPEFTELAARALAFLEAPRGAESLPLDIQGTAFQRRVWAALQQIPAGSTASYRQVAGGIGSPSAVRAVAQACAANPVAVAIPCHRVVRSDGGLGGYRWGVERKRKILDREAAA